MWPFTDLNRGSGDVCSQWQSRPSTMDPPTSEFDPKRTSAPTSGDARPQRSRWRLCSRLRVVGRGDSDALGKSDKFHLALPAW